MLCFLHGYLLDGSGSNLWTRHMVEALCQVGETVHLVCQENHPEHYPVLAQAYEYPESGKIVTRFDRTSPFPGKAIMHKPLLGDTLPVFVGDDYEEFAHATPMVDLTDDAIEAYLNRNVQALAGLFDRYRIRYILCNHAILMSVVAQRLSKATGIPFAIIPHGSGLEYAVKKDARLHRLASTALHHAHRVYLVSPEIGKRLQAMFPEQKDLSHKTCQLAVGVDTSRFQCISRSEVGQQLSKLKTSLAGLPTGKTRDQQQSLIERVAHTQSEADLIQSMQNGSHYQGKAPDADLVSKLDRIDWKQNKILLFVGRLIGAKGLQSLLAALPMVANAHPGFQLIVSGHGPYREVAEAMVTALRLGKNETLETLIRLGNPMEDNRSQAFFAGCQAFVAQLKKTDQWEAYVAAGQKGLNENSVIFTGYLTHRELAILVPCAEVVIIPSVVPEAGPMVLMEAMAAGCFPMGTYQAGLAANLDVIAPALGAELAEFTRLSPEQTITDIAKKLPQVLGLEAHWAQSLRGITVSHFDWRSLAQRLVDDLPKEVDPS